MCHAPRERVSWNIFVCFPALNSNLSRSTWACELKYKRWLCHFGRLCVTLHVSVWVEMVILIAALADKAQVTLHVSVWVEMYSLILGSKLPKGHAPRERVSWNYTLMVYIMTLNVTLHVSVWVEIGYDTTGGMWLSSRSTWACELKWSKRKVVKIC